MNKYALFLLASLTICAGCASTNLGLDSSPIVVLSEGKNSEETKLKLVQVMQYQGYKIDKSSDILEFRRGAKGVMGVLSASQSLQQEDVVNCLLINNDDGTLISCRAYLESVNRDGKESRTEKTQAIGYRKKLEAEIQQVNRNVL